MESLSKREQEKRLREIEIVVAAERVFGEKGFGEASMEEIAKAANSTKRTVYQYFENKDELYFAVMLKGLKRLLEYLQAESEKAETGYEKLWAACMGYYRFCQEYPKIMKLMGYLGTIRRNIKIESKNLKELMLFDDELFNAMAKVVLMGKVDGSIREDLDPMKTSLSLIFMMTGFFNQLSATGEGFTNHFSIEKKEFTIHSMELLLSSIRRNS